MRAALEPSTPAAGDLKSLHQVGCTSLAFSSFELSKKICCLFLLPRRHPARLSDGSANASGFACLVPIILGVFSPMSPRSFALASLDSVNTYAGTVSADARVGVIQRGAPYC